MTWPVKKLGDICEIISGATPSTSVKEYWGDDYFWATPKDLSDLNGAEIKTTSRKISALGLKSCATTLLPINSVLFSSRAPIGLVAINNVPIATNQGFKNLVPNRNLIDTRYLYHWLACNRKKIDAMGVGATFKEVSKAIVSKIEIPLPPLAEQQRIAALLDTADRILKQRELAIAKLDQLAQSLFFKIDQTASKHYKLSDISEIVSGSTPKSEIKEYWNGVVHWATPAELGKLNDIFINQTVRRITNEGLASCAATLLPINSILFSSRAPIGHIAINTVPMATNQGFKSFIVDKKFIEPLYLYYWLNHNKLLLQNMGVGATFKELSKSIISAVKIKLPSIDEQKEFTNTIGIIRDLKIKNLSAIEEIKNLLASLQHQSFAVN